MPYLDDEAKADQAPKTKYTLVMFITPGDQAQTIEALDQLPPSTIYLASEIEVGEQDRLAPDLMASTAEAFNRKIDDGGWPK
jgi:hypothetical protein